MDWIWLRRSLIFRLVAASLSCKAFTSGLSGWWKDREKVVTCGLNTSDNQGYYLCGSRHWQGWSSRNPSYSRCRADAVGAKAARPGCTAQLHGHCGAERADSIWAAQLGSWLSVLHIHVWLGHPEEAVGAMPPRHSLL